MATPPAAALTVVTPGHTAMLFPKHQHEAIRRGEITVAFRRWKRPSVRAGGTLRSPVGVLAIDEVAVITPDQVTDEDARFAGHADRAAALRSVESHEGRLYRIRFHVAGDDPRRLLAATEPDGRELQDALHELDRVDTRSQRPPWTRELLELIARRPETRAPDLAAELGRETAPFKRDVRRLKELGLTTSYPIGYRLSVRGQAVLAALRDVG